MQRRHFLQLSCLAGLWSLPTLPLSAAPTLAPFKDGQTIGFLGDSITARGTLQSHLANFYHTRFPERKLKFINAGRSGDSAAGARLRVEEDLLQYQPQVVFLMLGMNDVGRGNYVANPSPKQLEAQKASLARYEDNLLKLVEQVRSAPSKPQLVLLTPTPFDETLKQELENNQPGCNEALAKCATFIRALGAKLQVPVIDFHAKMTQFNAEQQKRNPRYTIVGPDRVHMGAEGYLMCAWMVLQAQGISPLVNQIEIRAASGDAKLLTLNRAQVSELQMRDQTLQFKAVSHSLPFPMPEETDYLQTQLPLVQDLNQERLQVEGLPAGTYQLSIDGVVITKQDAKSWASGVNLATFAQTPQAQQAQRVAGANQKRRAAESDALVLLNARRRIAQQHRIDPDDREAVQALYANAPDKTDYHIGMTKRYLERWKDYGTLRQQILEFDAEANQQKTPIAHQYELRRLP